MYPRKISQSIVSSKHNLQKLFNENTHLFFMFRQQFGELRNINYVNRKIQELIKNGKLYKLFMAFPRTSSRNQANIILKVWAHHCECVVAQRLRRCQQMFCLYSKWWEERALKELIRKMRQNLVKKGKELALAATGISAYNWEQNRIPEEDIRKYNKEFEYIYELKENTICMACDPTTKTNINTNICKCGTSGKLSTNTFEEWMPFIEKQDLIVWRRLHPSGQYEYKVYGSYNDVTAEDFLNVQIDTDYRRKWDNTAVVLEVGETDPSSNSDVLYWEMLWPRLFVNRDYVFNRRYLIDKQSNILYIVSRSTEHPKFPKNPDKFRIEDYWSCMVIKPYSDIKQPGIEFSLTYFDNPGVNIPTSVTTWVAMRAMPDFLEKLREATKNYRQYCLKEGLSKACKEIAEEERAEAERRERDKLDYCSFIRLTENIRLKSLYPKRPHDRNNKTDRHGLNSGNVTVKNVDNSPDSVQSKNNSFWKYFHPKYYFSVSNFLGMKSKRNTYPLKDELATAHKKLKEAVMSKQQ